MSTFNRTSETPAPLILVVDDNWMIRELMEAALQTAGYRVVTASSKAGALQLVAEQRPDLALVDVRLDSKSSGYELCRLLATPADPDALTVRVVMMTAHDTEEARQQAFAAGAVDFIPRSVDIPRFLNYIERILHAAGGAPGV